MLPVVLLIGFCTLVVKHGVTDVTAYKKGKEAPSIEKFRKRHQERQKWLDGERKLTTPAKRGGKEPGPMRKWFRAVRDNAADELIEKQNHKSQARRRWFRDNADQHEQQWQTKWQHKLDKRERQIQRWGQKKGVLDPAPAEPAEPDPAVEPATETPAEQESSQRSSEEVIRAWREALERGETTSVATADEWNALPSDMRDQLIREAQAANVTPVAGERTLTPARPTEDDEQQPATANPGRGEQSTPAQPEPTVRAGSTDTSTAPTTEGGTVHEQGAQELRDAAEKIRAFSEDLATFADGLSGRHYGHEITGTPTKASEIVIQAADIYADLAEEIQQQGDDVRNAHDATGHQIPDEAAMA